MLRQLSWRGFVPFILFILLLGVFWRGLYINPHRLPSTLINKNAPAFSLPNLFSLKTKITQASFHGRVTLVNVWATWCVACEQEHPILMDIHKQNKVAMLGWDYKDEAKAAKTLLQNKGNPFDKVAFDKQGVAALDWGIYGTPETYIVDKQGIIRYKHVGPLSTLVWERDMLPLIMRLEAAA